MTYPRKPDPSLRTRVLFCIVLTMCVATIPAAQPNHVKTITWLNEVNTEKTEQTVFTDGLEYFGISPMILDAPTNLKGRLVASVAFDQSGSTTLAHCVIDLYSYDEEGRMNCSYKFVPGLGIQKFEYFYNLQDNMTALRYSEDITNPNNSTRQTSHFTYSYDDYGRLESVRRGDDQWHTKKVADYHYHRNGLLNTKDLYRFDEALAATEAYQYNVRDWVTRKFYTDAASSQLYNQLIWYKFSGNEYCNGNIARTAIDYPGILGGTRSFEFSYDAVSRLTAVESSENDYDEAFSYFKDGRIKGKVKQSTTPPQDGDYTYFPVQGTSYPSNRLEKLAQHPEKSDDNNYVYSPNGSMIVDRSKNLIVEYDHRDMPVVFSFYTSIPAGIDWYTISRLDEATLVSRVEMMYDAAGNRVLKKETVQE